MIRRPPRSTRVRSSAASDVYKRQTQHHAPAEMFPPRGRTSTIDRGRETLTFRLLEPYLTQLSHDLLMLDFKRSTIRDGDHCERVRAFGISDRSGYRFDTYFVAIDRHPCIQRISAHCADARRPFGLPR